MVDVPAHNFPLSYLSRVDHNKRPWLGLHGWPPIASNFMPWSSHVSRQCAHMQLPWWFLSKPLSTLWSHLVHLSKSKWVISGMLLLHPSSPNGILHSVFALPFFGQELLLFLLHYPHVCSTLAPLILPLCSIHLWSISSPHMYNHRIQWPLFSNVYAISWSRFSHIQVVNNCMF